MQGGNATDLGKEEERGLEPGNQTLSFFQASPACPHPEGGRDGGDEHLLRAFCGPGPAIITLCGLSHLEY